MRQAFPLLGYLCGSIPFGVLLTRWLKGVDVRRQGSGNIGATNVARVAGKRLGILVLLLDALKGAVPVALAMRAAPDNLRLHALVGAVAVLGHVFPVWLKFRGGKGVATALGVLGVLIPLAAVVGFAFYAVIFGATRISSIGSLVGALAVVIFAFATRGVDPYSVLAGMLLGLMLYTHRSNIQRMLRHTEKSL